MRIGAGRQTIFCSPIRRRFLSLGGVEDDKHGRCSLTLFTSSLSTTRRLWIGLLVDETAVGFYEEKVRLSEQRLRMALDSEETGFWEQDLSSGRMSMNLNFFRMLGVEDLPA